jgi:hypothetical protein
MLDNLALLIRRECVHSLSRICGRRALLPSSLEVPFFYDHMDYPLASGGYGDVWKGRCHDQNVAVKVIRVYDTNRFSMITRVGYWWCSRLAISDHVFSIAFLRRGCRMESPLSSKHRAIVGRNNC